LRRTLQRWVILFNIAKSPAPSATEGDLGREMDVAINDNEATHLKFLLPSIGHSKPYDLSSTEIPDGK